MHRSPIATRRTPALPEQEVGTEDHTVTVTAEAPSLQAAMRELRQLRAERKQEREELMELRRRQRAAEYGRGEAAERQEDQGQCRFSVFKLRPDVYDGVESFEEFITQFELIARANVWSEEEKALVLAANLRGKARSVLDGVREGPNYNEIKSKLELCFGRHCQNYYTQFTNRKIQFGEDFASFGCELEKLARFAYPECSFEIRDKIACAQFIAGLSDVFIKQTLQLEGVVSLRLAIERARIIQEISGRGNFYKNQWRVGERENSSQKRERGAKRVPNEFSVGRNFTQSKVGEVGGNQQSSFRRECWQCGGTGHFRAECPALVQHPGK